MINNRQGGRRRGRGGQRGPNLGGGQPGGNRQDNRQRGNAAQLLEKYKSMARDSQLAGDRVQSEYYLQFADHYFRVLSESRARFEDQRRQRGDDGDEDDGDEDLMEVGADDGAETNESEPRRERAERPQRGERRERSNRGDGERRYARDDRSRDEDDGRNGVERGDGAEERIAMDVLPPAIGREDASGDEGEEEAVARPRRRTRRPRAQDGEGEIAPAA